MSATCYNRGCYRVLRVVLQLFQLVMGLVLLALGMTEFFMEPPLFDILGEPGTRPSLPANAFVRSRGLFTAQLVYVDDVLIGMRPLYRMFPVPAATMCLVE